MFRWNTKNNTLINIWILNDGLIKSDLLKYQLPECTFEFALQWNFKIHKNQGCSHIEVIAVYLACDVQVTEWTNAPVQTTNQTLHGPLNLCWSKFISSPKCLSNDFCHHFRRWTEASRHWIPGWTLWVSMFNLSTASKTLRMVLNCCKSLGKLELYI